MTNEEAVKVLTEMHDDFCETLKMMDLECVVAGRTLSEIISERMAEKMTAIDKAISALEKQTAVIQMLNEEKENGTAWHSRKYSDGRTSAFYDALGMNYAD